MQGNANPGRGWPHLAKIAGQRMSAETKATRAVDYARGVPVPESDENMREHERVVAKPSPNASAIPRGVRGKERLQSGEMPGA